MRVKVCGITTYEDALASVDAGVDALGFNFYPASPRYVRPEKARDIIARMPPFVVAVGLFVDVADSGEVVQIARAAGIQALQLHGSESPDYCRRLAGWPVIKALRIGNTPLDEDILAYPVCALLLDVRDENLFGGTGTSFDWDLAAQIPRNRPIILAGGLKPENISRARQ